ncbi:MAG: hypothetical protein A2315_12635 [Ignavibacteria bacterium RIFOXYB2_FULL_35_12]|nr:MAG: hypothetical protein A2058_05515 [Ignavibacteria bacterium GWA2_36_19]OGU50905.1 MAG: hypothetical protein A2006_04235 [Ignavibacteria bacterium GWC2_35_8]OGU57397.1 MAG: hypothetical protein A2X60_16560 [Ignavibacteria bacterium GWF2_35_20]OGU78166.1 MAG: hypothetical protein A2254_17245 [Ignavibacteria bacterium RIFOXYA2_FULL_35_9]OGU88334.1 MAG: hypothetical protein A2492_08595 [Ignavibacteria bacterium RIFOXYC12_FULL_35_11]OGU91595.1 MAG: hypothetical protein A3K31_02775 [Ignavibac
MATYKCPVCGKILTEVEYDKALGLWKEKQEHIRHLEEEQKKFKEKEKAIKKTLENERKRLKQQGVEYKKQVRQQAKQFKAEQTKLSTETKKMLSEQSKKSELKLREQRSQLEKSFQLRMKSEIKKGIEQGVTEQKKLFKKQETEFKRTQNKMIQLENSLKVSAKKYEQANEEIKKLKEQIEKGITPQIEGLLEESKLLTKLKELFPKDKFEHPGKGGDIIQFVVEQGKEIGRIVYECKKVKSFNKNHIEQAKEARRLREADFAILVTNAFPSKKQYYFVEKTVFVISPVSLEPITYTLRESLVKIALLKVTNEAKQKAVQQVYDYLSSSEYNNKMNDVANQLIDLAKDLKVEIKSHRDRWEKRYSIYIRLYSDVGLIDSKLKGLVQNQLTDKTKLLPPPKKEFVEIKELEH